MSAVCALLVGHGQTCTDFDACPSGDLCVGLAAGGGSGTCTTILDVGSTCDPTKDACPADAPCDKDKHLCTKPAQPMEGSACTGLGTCLSNGGFVGNDALYCDSGSHMCTKRLRTGDACVPATTNDDPCITACSPSTNTCVQGMSCFF
jgi:hypothetical protein